MGPGRGNDGRWGGSMLERMTSGVLYFSGRRRGGCRMEDELASVAFVGFGYNSGILFTDLLFFWLCNFLTTLYVCSLGVFSTGINESSLDFEECFLVLWWRSMYVICICDYYE